MYANVAIRLFFAFFFAVYIVTFIVSALATIFRDLNTGGFEDCPDIFHSLTMIFFETTGLYMKAELEGILTIMLFIVIVSYLLTRLVLSPLKEASDRQRLFAANASHELRTPLSVLKTLAEVARMRSANLSKEDVETFANDIGEEVDRMSRIIEFFVRFSALEDSEHRLQMTPVRLARLAESVFHSIEHFANERGVTVSITRELEGVVRGNFTALEELLANLVKNAVFFSPRGSTVSITSKVRETSVYLIVSDNGRGISKEDLPHIFEPFYQNGGKKHGGSGLGLTLVKQIAKLHHAKIEVKSKVGEGTTFTIQFPR